MIIITETKYLKKLPLSFSFYTESFRNLLTLFRQKIFGTHFSLIYSQSKAGFDKTLTPRQLTPTDPL